MAVLSLTVAYNGTPFAGFARQPGQLTVQGSLEEALSLVFRHPVETVCAGRTDSGVHARGQVVSFTVDDEEWRERSEYKLLRSLNALTHEDVSVLSVEERDADFSARFSATLREYRYFICTDRHAPLLMKGFSWHLAKDLDVDAMRQAAGHLIGERDFKSFCVAASAEGKSTMRNVFRVSVDREQMWGENLVVITVEGNAFLHSMVRTMVGTLVAVGLGNRTPDWIINVLEARDRGAAGENAPAQGLVFWRVSYEGERVHDPRTGASGSDVAASGAVGGVFSAMGAYFEQAEENARRRETAVQGRARHRRSGSRRNADVVVPRGDGRHVISGSGYSDVRDDGSSFDLARDFMAYRNAGSHPGEVRVYADDGMFGDVMWDDLADAEFDEPMLDEYVVVGPEGVVAATEITAKLEPVVQEIASDDEVAAAEPSTALDEPAQIKESAQREEAELEQSEEAVPAPLTPRQTRITISESAVVKAGPYPFQRK